MTVVFQRRMRVLPNAALMLGLLALLLLVAACKDTTTTATGVLQGKVTIGPLCPVEPCPGAVPNPYVSRSLVLGPSNSGDAIMVKLNEDGTYRAEVAEGTYTVQLTSCTYLGCSRALPQQTTVSAGKTTELAIDIDTGIR